MVSVDMLNSLEDLQSQKRFKMAKKWPEITIFAYYNHFSYEISVEKLLDVQNFYIKYQLIHFYRAENGQAFTLSM